MHIKIRITTVAAWQEWCVCNKGRACTPYTARRWRASGVARSAMWLSTKTNKRTKQEACPGSRPQRWGGEKGKKVQKEEAAGPKHGAVREDGLVCGEDCSNKWTMSSNRRKERWRCKLSEAAHSRQGGLNCTEPWNGVPWHRPKALKMFQSLGNVQKSIVRLGPYPFEKTPKDCYQGILSFS